MNEALNKLARALAQHFDFNPDMPDETPVFLEPIGENCSYELTDTEGLRLRLTLGDLRAIADLANG